MKSAFVISDVHLTKMASPKGEAILSLLDQAQKECDHFIILGDLFDLWVGEGSHFQKEFAPLIARFKKLKETAKIYYFEGNHDLHLDPFWKNQMGFEVFQGPRSFNYGKLQIRAEHGDEINRHDYGYLFLRWFLRTPPMRYVSMRAPSKLVALIGQTASEASRDYTSQKKNDSLNLFRAYAQELRLREPFDLLLTGHTHIPDDYKFETPKGGGRLINLGSWFDGPHFLKIFMNGEIQQQSC